MRKYEIMVIFSGKLDETKLKELDTAINSKITEDGGKVSKKEVVGLKDFAYEIKKEKKGYYNIYYSETGSDNIDEINRYYRITSEILRVMVIKHDDKWPYEMNANVKNKLPIRHSKKNYKKRFDSSRDKNFDPTKSKVDSDKRTSENKEVKDGK